MEEKLLFRKVRTDLYNEFSVVISVGRLEIRKIIYRSFTNDS